MMKIVWKTKREPGSVWYWFCISDEYYVAIKKFAKEKKYRWSLEKEGYEDPDIVLVSGLEDYLKVAKRKCEEAMNNFLSA